MAGRGKSAYRRARAVREPESAILVVTEGAKTEPKYLYALSRHLHLGATEVVVCQADGTDPGRIVDCAISIKRQRRIEAKRGEVFEYREVWAVFDTETDVDRPELNNALVKASDNQIRVALSAPCFEYWFILHFECTTALVLTYKAAAKRLKQHVPDYDKANPPVATLIPLVARAVGHAATCRVKQDEVDAKIPRTNVDELVTSMNGATRPYYRVL